MALIELKHVTKKYADVTALDDVSLSIEKGRIVGLLGPNGSGKTTMIKLANGLLTASSGTIEINGMEPSKETKAICAYLPDQDFLPKYETPERLLKMYSDYFADFNAQKARDMLKDLGISFDRRISEMSKGTREKMQLCLIMSREAMVYWLDEPIGGVDPAAREYILNTIISNYRKDAAVIISTHLIADVENVLDDVIFIRQGHVVLHQPADEIREEKKMSIENLFKEEFRC